MAKINYRAITTSIATSEVGKKRIHTIANRRFEASKAQLLKDFDNHDVTKEVAGKLDSSNISGTLRGKGNLFSFIGFEQGSDPINPVRQALEVGVTMAESSKRINDRSIEYKFSIREPVDEIKRASPLPFEEGKSWVYGIERGISGFGHYLRGVFGSPKPSKSGGGIQTEHLVRPGEFKTRDYLKELFTKFIANFKNY